MKTDTTPCQICHAAVAPGSAKCDSCGYEFRTEEAETLAPDNCRSSVGPSLPHPRQLGEFRIERELGRGGMGVVYEAIQPSLRRRVALKVLDAGFFEPSGLQVVRFRREAWIGGKLTHPNIVKVHANGCDDGVHYIAMELIEGRSLTEVIRQAHANLVEGGSSKPVVERHVRHMLELFVGVAEALEHVHKSGVIHRDIKPGNLLLSADGTRLMLSDFGLARDADASQLTRRGDFLGTIGYMSPEQLLAQRAQLDARSDIYSLGVTVYEAVTGQLPFRADSEQAFICAVSTKEPIPARSLNRGLSRDLETVLMKCLERDPDRRYTTAGELAADLQRLLADEPVHARRIGVVRRALRWISRDRWRLTASLLLVLLVLVVLAVLQRSRQVSSNGDSIVSAPPEDAVARLSGVLERAFDFGKTPVEIDPEWPNLKGELRQLLIDDPASELSQLGLKLGISVSSDLPSFGLTNTPPLLSFSFEGGGLDFQVPFEDDRPLVVYIIDMQTSWDGGTWRTVSSQASKIKRGGSSLGLGMSLRKMVESELIPVGPHRLDVRARCSVYRSSEILQADWDENIQPILGSSINADFPRSSLPKPIVEYVTDVNEHTISLFEEYPPDFPRSVTWDESAGDISDWFSIDRARLVLVDYPAGNEPFVTYEFENWSGSLQAKRSEAVNGRPLHLSIEGRFDTEIPVPMAAEVTARTAKESGSLFRFTWALGPRVRSGTSSRTEADGQSELYGLEIDQADLTELKLEDGQHDLVLEFRPSRKIALDTRQFDRYLGETLHLDVPVQIVTVLGSRVTEEEMDEEKRKKMDALMEVMTRDRNH